MVAHPLLSVSNVSKSFGSVSVLHSITFEAHAGEIIALVGENGAGKSTLMKILSGVWPQGSFTGSLAILGEPVFFSSTKSAQKKGISIINQELHLIPELSIAENIFLGKEPHRLGIIDKEALHQSTQKILQELDISLSPTIPVKYLSVGEKQMIEIAKALSHKTQILILDEPTSALTDKEIKKLFLVLKKLKSEGVLCLYISHKLEEVFEISDKIFVLRDGKLVAQKITTSATSTQIITDMVGREISEMYPPRTPSFGKTVLEVSHLTCRTDRGKKILNDISFSVREGEILGFSGLMGAGRSELINTLFGATDFDLFGNIFLQGKEFKPSSPRHAIESGLSLLTEDRKFSGIIPQRSVRDNMTLASLHHYSHKKIINLPKEKEIVKNFVQQFKIKTQSLRTDMTHLSGGNQQKVLLARWLLTKPKVLFLDEPTRGVDVGAKVEIYTLMNELARNGVAILLISSDLPEVLKMSDTIAILNQGCLTGILPSCEASQEKVMHLATTKATTRIAA